MKYIAVDGMVLTFDPQTVTGVITLGSASTKSKVTGLGVYVDGLSFSISGLADSATQMVASGLGTGTIDTTALKTKSEGTFVLLEGDSSVDISVPAVHSSSGATGTVDFSLSISSAGQTKVKGS